MCLVGMIGWASCHPARCGSSRTPSQGLPQPERKGCTPMTASSLLLGCWGGRELSGGGCGGGRKFVCALSWLESDDGVGWGDGGDRPYKMQRFLVTTTENELF